MNKITFLLAISILLLTSAAQATAQLKIACDDTVEGFKVTASFDSTIPQFSSSVFINPQKPTETQFFSGDKVCGQNINFASNCSGSVVTFQGDTGYQFSCKNGISGELVLSSDQLTFTCSGPQVSSDYENGIFTGCKTTN